MTIREAFGIVALVILVQLVLGVILYGPLRPVPGLDISLILVAIAVMAVVAGGVAAVLALLLRRYSSERSIRLALMTLSEDERKVLEAILKSGGKAYQDKLRRELDISKSKLSALVNNLEKKHAITKERYFRTNILKLSKEFSGK